MILSRDYSRECVELFARLLGRSWDKVDELLQGLRVGAAYEAFRLPKGNGKFREIENPIPKLKDLQRGILDHILYRALYAPDCHGFVPGRSIVSHARLHRRQNCLVNFDIADAFPSVNRQRTVHSLGRSLGTWLKHRAPRAPQPVRDELWELIGDLGTHANRLPQGAPTSGALLNLALKPLDRRLRTACRRWRQAGLGRLIYSRYADDLTISSEQSLPTEVEKEIRRAIIQTGFRFNPAKIHRADRRKGQALVVCGVQVDGDALRLPRRQLMNYRALFHQALFADTLDAPTRGRIAGVAGLVLMVYGQWPPTLDRPWRLLAAKHALKDRSAGESAPPLGYGGVS